MPRIYGLRGITKPDKLTPKVVGWVEEPKPNILIQQIAVFVGLRYRLTQPTGTLLWLGRAIA
ncbi:MAG: hypothetical protein QNJ74_11615 [Trichodesmium sp. MO_231.B1]|nr:hypothetical protein [Trichodesmium sp. MO_231.B1]